MIASLHVNAMEGGTSINDLVDRIRQHVADPELLIRLDAVITQVAGQNWRALRDNHFDLHVAIDTLRFYDAASIPAVSLPIPTEVSSVTFRVDLSHLGLSQPDQLIAASHLFRAATTSA